MGFRCCETLRRNNLAIHARDFASGRPRTRAEASVDIGGRGNRGSLAGLAGRSEPAALSLSPCAFFARAALSECFDSCQVPLRLRAKAANINFASVPGNEGAIGEITFPALGLGQEIARQLAFLCQHFLHGHGSLSPDFRTKTPGGGSVRPPPRQGGARSMAPNFYLESARADAWFRRAKLTITMVTLPAARFRGRYRVSLPRNSACGLPSSPAP